MENDHDPGPLYQNQLEDPKAQALFDDFLNGMTLVICLIFEKLTMCMFSIGTQGACVCCLYFYRRMVKLWFEQLGRTITIISNTIAKRSQKINWIRIYYHLTVTM